MFNRLFAPQAVTAQTAQTGRDAFAVPERHADSGHRIVPPFPSGLQRAVFGMGCFWGAKRKLWQQPGCLQHRCWLCGWLYTPSDL